MTARSINKPTFNLIDDPWLRCLDVHGEAKTVSLRELFERITEFSRLAGELPTQDMAIFRILLVIFWRAHHDVPKLKNSGAEDRSEWWIEEFTGDTDFAPRVLAYLEQHRDRFELFHPVTPFMQVADLQTAKDTYNDLGKLIPDSESEYFSMRAGSGLDDISFAEAARWLIHLHAWDYAGIKPGVLRDKNVKGGKSYSIGTGWSGRSGGVILHGSNLRESLLLNTNPDEVFTEDQAQDLPVWERAADGPGTTGKERSTGPCDLLTWQSRRVRLFTRNNRVVGVLATNGDKLELKNHFNDPMTAYRYSKPQSKKHQIVHMPKTHDASRTLWRGIEPLLVREGVVEGPAETRDKQPATVRWLHEMRRFDEQLLKNNVIGVELVGQEYGPQDSTYFLTIHEELPLRLSLLVDSDPAASHLLVTTANSTMNAAIAVGQFAGNLAVAAGGTYEFQADQTDAVLHRLNEPFKQWLTSYSPDADPLERRRQWFRYAKHISLRIAQDLVRGAGSSALIGREVDERLVSAATAWNILQSQLNKHLTSEPPGAQQKSANQRKVTA